MAALASASTSSPRALEPHRSGSFSDKASSSGGAESSAVAAEEGVLDLDSPWVAAAEAESRLEAATAVGVGLSVLGDEELEEYEIRDNQQRQEDELTALEAIYGDDLIVFENKGGLRSFQIYIHYDFPDGIKVCAKLSAPNASPSDVGWCEDYKHDDGPDEFSYTCGFEYLPPLILTCLLPRSYPSKDPPGFVVTAKWMDGPYVSQLCQMLDTIWAGLPGQEVVYQWVEWLRISSMSYLWTDGNMTLGPDVVNHSADNRAISRANSLESVIPLMLNYSSKKRYQDFLEAIHMCMICLNETKGSNFIRLPCQHLFCVKCMETLCRLHVKEGSVFQLVCPDNKCKDSIPPYVLKRLLKEAEYERWDRLLLQKTLDAMSNVVYCPNCVIGCMEDEENNVQCPKCSFIFCSFCKGPCHPGKKCLTPEEKIQLRKVSGRMTEKEMAQELFNIRQLYRDVRLCPKCRMAIVKTEGCNKMSCGNCGQLLCFRCGRAIDGYDHFWNGGCVLFELRQYSDVTPFERHMEEVQIGRRTKVQLSPIGSTVRCPKCRQRNFKDSEEYIFCWACRIHYCSLCRMRVEDKYMKSGHYGSSECVGLGNF